ncbi:MAG: NupC/NupG family nucleoside CNT transporter [Bacteriovoracaceae bacterium]|nr:NupC/NupG family nucleoside CNT transporter [Bacteriovoracaceae bacterium]
MERLISLVGLFSFLGICYALSNNRKKIIWRPVIYGIIIQLTFGIFIIKTQIGLSFFDLVKDMFNAILGFSTKGGAFIFGDLASQAKVGFVFATMVIPTIIFMGSLMSVLYHIGIMQKIVGFTAWIMMKVMGTSGAESLAAAANIFVGQTEAPLVVRPYIEKMTNSELMALMVGGFATIAGGVLAAFVGLGIDAGHLLAASVMSAPAALVCAKIMYPETEVPVTKGNAKLKDAAIYTNVVEAAAAGAGDGMMLALNVTAMLLAFIALIAMLNALISWGGGFVGMPQLSFELILGYLFWPIAFLMGTPVPDCLNVGILLGKKMALNEFVAYLDLMAMKGTMSERATVLSTYALCGFSNFSSIAIQIGGIGTLAPSRKPDLARLGLKAMFAGTLACLMTAAVAGLFI